MKEFTPGRLGTAGSYDVKEHHYFYGLDWNSLLRMKADFIPQLEDEEDISYFDSRLDRYNHEIEQTEDDSTNRSSAEDTDADTTGAGAAAASFGSQSMFASFTSASPRYRKAAGSSSGGSARDPALIAHRHSMSVCESTTLPDSPGGVSGGGRGGSHSAAAAAVEHKVLSPELRRCQQQHVGRPEVRRGARD